MRNEYSYLIQTSPVCTNSYVTLHYTYLFLLYFSFFLSHITCRRDFTRNGKLLTKGDLLKRPQLAKTLQLIARAGSAEPFYNGPMSKTLIKEIRAAGGVLTLKDLKNYKVKFRPALKSKLDDMTLLSTPPPTAGPVLALTLNILDGEITFWNIAERGSFECTKRTWGQRDAICDSQRVSVGLFLDITVTVYYCSKHRPFWC